MASNHLEQLVAEWYEYQGYFVRRNVRVGPRRQGGHEGELDVVAFNPAANPPSLLHVETSMDAHSWAEREERFSRKFAVGEKYIRTLFHGITPDISVRKIALFGLGSDKNHPTVGGGEVMTIDKLLVEILSKLKGVSWFKRAVPEQYPLLRTLQLVAEYRLTVTEVLREPAP